jgi:hypothetical protein
MYVFFDTYIHTYIRTRIYIYIHSIVYIFISIHTYMHIYRWLGDNCLSDSLEVSRCVISYLWAILSHTYIH